MKISKKLYVILAIGIFCIMAIFMFRNEFIASFKEPVNINLVEADELKPGMRVKGTLDLVFDYYCEIERTEKKFLIDVNKDTTGRYYVIPAGTYENNKYISFIGHQGQFDTLDTIMDNTLAYYEGTADTYGSVTLSYEGIIEKLDKEATTYFIEWFGVEDDMTVFNEYTLPFQIKNMNFDGLRIFVIICAGVLVLDVLFGVFYFLRRRS